MGGEPSPVSDLSDARALVNGPESRFVIEALEALEDGDDALAEASLAAGAVATSWAAVLRRLDVAGRALLADDPDATQQAPVGVVIERWAAGEGVPASVDLTTGAVDARTDAERAWDGLAALGWLVARSGFPPQVVV